jgi:predicted esterase YcpF (UPF0227 family)
MTRCLYLHGFASGPSSTKAVAFADAFKRRGVVVERLDLRVPSLERMRLSKMIAHVEGVIAGERVVLIGSSLGGLTAARVAERVPSVQALVLMAPAFRMAERWRARLGEEAYGAWQRSGWLEVQDYVAKKQARVDFGFIEDALAVDAAGDGWPVVTAPTWIAHGTRDEVVDVGLSREWAARTPGWSSWATATSCWRR